MSTPLTHISVQTDITLTFIFLWPRKQVLFLISSFRSQELFSVPMQKKNKTLIHKGEISRRCLSRETSIGTEIKQGRGEM